jgi:DNA-binding beta-propeller fold protein YncE
MGTGSTVTTSPTPKTNTNLIVTAVSGLPAAVRSHDKNAVSIFGERLSEVLEAYYSAGVRWVDVAVGLDGQQLVVTCTIHKKVDRRTNRVYYWLYPLGTGQYLLRERYKAFRGAAERYAKTPMPIVIYSIMPKKTA